MALPVPNVKMTNGVDLPLFGFGTWLAKDPVELRNALQAALDAGYRYIDSAQSYGNEVDVGEFLEEKFKSGVLKRSDIFITSKLSNRKFDPKVAEESILKSLGDLKTDYIDLFLIHSPMGFKDVKFAPAPDGYIVPDPTPHIDTWRVLEKYYKLGKLKSIGLSNFNQEQIQDLYDKAEIKPHNLQIEANIYFPRVELVEFCHKLGITVTSYATLGSPGRANAGTYGDPALPEDYLTDPKPLEEPVVMELAKKYNKKPEQVLLRQMLQRGISVIPKSVKPERVKANADIFDFELTKEEVEKLNNLSTRRILFYWPFAKTHPNYPYAAGAHY